MILVDSSVWIDYFNGNETIESNYLDSCLDTQEIVIGDLILAEVLQGFRSDKDYDLAKDLLTSLTVVHLVSPELAIKSANNFRLLRKKGTTVRKTIDVLIATYCIEKQIPLLQSDRDFIPFSEHLGLRLISKSM